MRYIYAIICFALVSGIAFGTDTFVPYSADNVPDNVIDLWKDVDLRKDALETNIVKEWVEEGVVCRYVTFKVGTFKGVDSRIAAFYTFPKGAKDAPAFVWAHGGGQCSKLKRGLYFAKHGYAMVDINWGGREILEGVHENTDWGAIDPSQGTKFYPGAKRKSTKADFLPDEYTIDPVISPRNGNWFMLAYAGRRAITFLEQQIEVDANKIGFTGFSMGGNITSYVSIDPRLKAVVPMVGGAGFITTDSAGMPQSRRAVTHKEYNEFFANTMESQSYYPYTKAPVLLLSASNDFHARFEFIYQCMEALPHDNWRVSQKMHISHNIGAEQWIMINRWFDKYLKGEAIEIPKTAKSSLEVDEKKGSAVFSVLPDQSDEVVKLDVYYSHDPNEKSRFWIHANAKKSDSMWKVTLPVRKNLPLYVFANCAYPLDEPIEAFVGIASTYTITSNEEAYLPEIIKAETLFTEAQPTAVFSDIEKDGFRDWGLNTQGGMNTYKFRDPRYSLPPSPEAKLKVTVNAPREDLRFEFNIMKNNYITGSKEPRTTYSLKKSVDQIDSDEVFLLSASDFKGQSKNKNKGGMVDWANISEFGIAIYEGNSKIKQDFTDVSNSGIIKKIEWVNP